MQTVYLLNSADFDLLQDCSTREAFEEVLFSGHSIHLTLDGAQQAALDIERDIRDDIRDEDDGEEPEEPFLNWEETRAAAPDGTEVRSWRTKEEDSIGALVYLIRAIELSA